MDLFLTSTVNNIYINFTPVVGIIFGFIFLRYNSKLERHNKFLFTVCNILIALDLLSFNMESRYAAMQMLENPRIYWSILGYTVRPAVLCFMIYIGMNPKTDRLKYYVYFIPELVNILLSVSVLFSREVYWYSADNAFHRGRLGYFNYIIIGIYFSIFIFETFYLRFGKKLRKQSIIAVFCMVVLVVAMWLEHVYGACGISRSAMIIALTFYYMYFQSSAYDEEHNMTSYIAMHDALTGLYNRYAYDVFYERLEPEKTDIGIIIIDVDRFKKINDTYGHGAGDKVLKDVARLLTQNFRSSDMIIRYGGDEFVVLMPGVVKKDAAVIINKLANIQRLLRAAKPDMKQLGLSSGIAMSKLGIGDDLFKRADEALYRSKARGGGVCTIAKNPEPGEQYMAENTFKNTDISRMLNKDT